MSAEAKERPSAAPAHPLAWTLEDWGAWLERHGERAYRARQIFRWIHKSGVVEPEAMTNLSRELRARLTELGLRMPASVHRVARADDGTRKLLLELSDGARVECVLIPMTRERTLEDADLAALGDDDEEGEREDEPSFDRAERATPSRATPSRSAPSRLARVTLCISTQHGCAMGCVFCASGQAGLGRGLSPEEILAQVLVSRRHLEPGEELRNLVFMGMGEPLHHYESTVRALRLLTHPEGTGMSPRRITVSTVGLVPGIQRLGEDFQGKIGLAISLHAADDETRSRIIPLNRRYPLRELLAALRRYPLPKRRRITIEYTLIAGINDAAEHADRLARTLRGLPVKINLIPMNPIPGSELRAPPSARVHAFRELLAGRGYSASVRKRRGDEVDAACGQLALASELVRGRKAT